MYYFPVYFCVDCNSIMNDSGRIRNNGMCPSCGHITLNSSICATIKKRAHYEKNPDAPFWKRLLGLDNKLVIEGDIQ